MIRKCDKDVKVALKECESVVFENTGYDIQLVVKEMNDPIQLEEDDFEIDEFEIPEERKLKWDRDYLSSLKSKKPSNTYLMRKKYVEIFSAKF